MDYNDDWLYDSIKNYHTLNMYNLQMKPQHLVKVDQERLCLAGKYPYSNRTEILCIKIPQKLFMSQEERGRCKHNDFEIDSGGFVDDTVILSIKALNVEKIVAAIKDNPGLTLFNLDNLKPETILNHLNCFNVDKNPFQEEILTCTESKFIIYDLLSQQLSEKDKSNILKTTVDCCYFNNDVLAFIDQTFGSILLFDRRNEQELIVDEKPTGTGFVFSTDFCKNRVVSVNNEGHFFVYDSRFPGTPLIQKNLKLENCSKNVKVRLMNDNFSLSGFDNSVAVYDISGNEIRQVFQHYGHNDASLSHVTDHAWLPYLSDRFLVSCADNGSLNCWEFVPKS